MRCYLAPTQEQPTGRASQDLGRLVPQLRDLEGNREAQPGNSTRQKGLVFPLRSNHGIRLDELTVLGWRCLLEPRTAPRSTFHHTTKIVRLGGDM